MHKLGGGDPVPACLTRTHVWGDAVWRLCLSLLLACRAERIAPQQAPAAAPRTRRRPGRLAPGFLWRCLASRGWLAAVSLAPMDSVTVPVPPYGRLGLVFVLVVTQGLLLSC